MIVSRREMANAGSVCDIISLFSWRSQGPPTFIYTSVCTALPFQRSGNSSLPPLSSVLSHCLSLILYTLSILYLKLSHVTLHSQVLRIRHKWMSFWFLPEKKRLLSAEQAILKSSFSHRTALTDHVLYSRWYDQYGSGKSKCFPRAFCSCC